MNSALRSPGKRRVSDTVFFGFVALLAIAIIGVGIYLIGPVGSSRAHGAVPGSSPSVLHAPSPPPRSSKAAAVALVAKYFRLTAHGKAAKACALESPAYLRADARRFPNGGCVGEQRILIRQVALHGLILELTNLKVVSFGGSKATLLATAKVGERSHTEHVYLRYHRGTWWLTGGDDSHGDLGY